MILSRSAPSPIVPRIAAISVGYDSERVLEPFFRTLRDSTVSPLLILLADNKPREDSPTKELARQFAVDYLPMKSNRGYGGAVNAAAQILPPSVDWILICNPDLTFGVRSLDVLVNRGDSEPDAGAIGPAIHTAEGAVYPSARAIPSLRTGVGHALFANVWKKNPWTAAYRNESVEQGKVGWLSGACLLVRRTAFDQIGGFDEGFFMYFEDVDLGYRLGKAGFRNLYEPNAVVTHTGAHSTAAEASLMLTAHHESAKRFLTKKYPGWLLWPVRLALNIGLDTRVKLLERKKRKASL